MKKYKEDFRSWYMQITWSYATIIMLNQFFILWSFDLFSL